MSRRRIVRCVVAGLVVVLLLSVAAGISAGETVDDNSDTTIEDVEFDGDGYIHTQYETVEDHPGPPFVWRSEPLNVTVSVSSERESGQMELCGYLLDEDGEQTDAFDCETFTVSEEPTEVPLELAGWPDDTPQEQSIAFELHGVWNNEQINQDAKTVFVIEKDGDLTGDGLTNEEEVAHGTDFTDPDTSGNGLTDWEEIKKYDTDPRSADTTGDGIEDGTIVMLGLDPTEPYIVHTYATGLLGILLVTIGIAFYALRRIVDRPVVRTEGSGDVASEPESAERHDTGQDESSAVRLEPPEESLLTHEEYVCQLLAIEDGRLKQQAIVEQTGWSKAKVSRVLSDLEEEGRIQKRRIGRENIVDLIDDSLVEQESSTGEQSQGMSGS